MLKPPLPGPGLDDPGNGDQPALDPSARTIVARNLRAARGAACLTQAQLAAMTGLATMTVSRAERGTLNLTLDTIQRLARGVGVEMDTLLRDAGPRREA